MESTREQRIQSISFLDEPILSARVLSHASADGGRGDREVSSPGAGIGSQGAMIIRGPKR